MPTIFLAGIYGVGKSTLAEELSLKVGIPVYSAGALISDVNGEIYGANKYVTNKYLNQEILAACVSVLLQSNNRIILAGHFCILNADGTVEKIPDTVFTKLQIEKIILLEAQPKIIKKHLTGRDGKEYSLRSIENILLAERQCAQSTAQKLQCPLIVHTMHYTNQDVAELMCRL